VRDIKGKWLEANIVELVEDQYMKVHFRGWNKKWDENIYINHQ